MTCIIAYKHAKTNTIFMGSDRQTTGGETKETRSLPKTKRLQDTNGTEFLIGSAGNLRLCQLVHFFKIPQFPISTQYNDLFKKHVMIQEKDEYEYMIMDFIPLFQEFFKKNGCLNIKDSVCSVPFCSLVCFNGKIFSIGNDFSVSQTNDCFSCVGSGCGEAMGFLSSYISNDKDLKMTNDDIRKMIKDTLFFVSKQNIYCNNEIDVISIQYE